MTLVDSLSGVPGRKVVLFVSQGIPTNPNADLFVEFGERFTGGQGQSVLSPENRLDAPRASGRAPRQRQPDHVLHDQRGIRGRVRDLRGGAGSQRFAPRNE